MESLSDKAKRHLWMHFTRLGSFDDHDVPIIARGEGCYVWDQHGRRYFDGLSGLFTAQVGHSHPELADAAHRQMSTLEFFPVWSYAHEPAIELAHRLASLAPGDLNRVFLTPTGGDAVEAAIKLARQYWKLRGQGSKTKLISRTFAYHGTNLGALSLTGVPAIKTPFEPLLPGVVKIQTPYRYRCHDCGHLDACTLRCADDLALRIEMEGPDTVAAVFAEPMQNTGGAFTPPEGYWQRMREICDEYNVLLVSDEVICAFGRLGTWFGCERYGYQPDMVTFAKGVTSGHAPLGGVMIADHLAEPFLADPASFLHGQTYGAHPVSCAVALANLDVMERDGLLDRVNSMEAGFKQRLNALRDISIVGDVRGDGFFAAVELVTDQATKGTFDDAQAEWLLRGQLSPRLYDGGLICRADDRAEPVLTLSPPLITSEEQLDECVAVIRDALTATADAFAESW
jgi:adenosylmethionine-8-amino-7-oxononanoate aminotransferase